MSNGFVPDTSKTLNRSHIGSSGAEIAAAGICKHPIDLSHRKEVRGYAIDSADPDSPMDRDDAIGIRYSDDAVRGQLTTLDISIADVASVCTQAQKPLDEFAFTNGETLYFPHGVSPMLPRRLQDRMSLENGRERPAITVSVTFDKEGNTVHTEFARTRIKAKCKSYREAARDILLYGDPIQQISVVATRLLGRKSGVTNLPHYDEHTGTYTDAEGNIRHISRDEVSAFTTVQGSMIAANEASADIMSESPFLFRNHSHAYRDGTEFYSKREIGGGGEEGKGRLIQNKAEYSPACKGHFGLDAERYSHVTSPMRRYADLVNQRMMGWAIDVVEAIARSITSDPRWDSTACPPERVSYIVWDHARELLGKTAALTKGGTQKIVTENALEDAIATLVQEIPGTADSHASYIAESAVAAIRTIDLPYTPKQLGEIAESLNETLTRNRTLRREMQIDEANGWLDKVFSAPDHKILKAWGSDAFARLLEAAARRGDNHDIFAKEVSQRLEEDSGALVHNLHSILVVAQRYKDSHWQGLKRQAFQMLKDRPELTEQVFAYMQKNHEDSPFILEATLLDRQRHAHPSALVVLSHAGTDYSAPIIDTADTPGNARHAAMLTFFRHYGDLYPHQEMQTPKLIDLALERARVQKGERLALLHKMCDPNFDIVATRRIIEEPMRRLEVTLSVVGKEDGQIMTKTRAGTPTTYDQIIDKCAKDMLADRRFLDMLAQAHNDTTMDEKENGSEAPPTIIWNASTSAGSPIERRPSPLR